MKLKAVLAVTAALSFGGAFAQANFSDVPAGHWAKDAVEKMAAQGCIIGFPDGTFRGNEGLTRYQAALILARCLQNTTVVGGLDNETVESLKNAVQELSSELAALGVRIADVEDNAATKDDVAVLEERIAALEEAAGDKGEPVEGGDEGAGAELQAAIDELVAADEAAAAQIEDLTGALDELVNQLEELATAQDDLTSRVEALEAGAGEVEDNGDVTAALEDLAAGQDDLNGRVDELAATLDDVAVSIDDLNARVDELAAAGEENAAVLEEINARIEELAGAIDDVNVRVDELEGTVGDVAATVEGQTEQIESNAASIVALQDLTVLLNEDIVGLEDRISALESDKANAEDVDARFTNLNRDLTDLTNRVTVVETNLSDLQGKFNTLNGNFGFTVSGELSSTYYVSRVKGSNFDIDRIIPGTKFSTGVDGDGDDKTKDRPSDWADFSGSRTKVGEQVGFVAPTTYLLDLDTTVDDAADADAVKDNDVQLVVTTDLANPTLAQLLQLGGKSAAAFPNAAVIGTLVPNGSVEGSTKTNLSISLDFSNRSLEGKSAYSGAQAADTQAFQVQKVVAEFGVADMNYSGNVSADTSYVTNGLAFYVKNVTTQFDVNGNPIVFKIGPNLTTKFTDYVFDNDDAGYGDGYLATVDGSSLPGLGAFSPKIVVAYGSKGGVNGDNTYSSAIRATIAPVAGLTLGVNAGQSGTDNQAATQSRSQVLGADLKGNVAGWNLQSEYAQETKDGVNNTDSVFYAHADGGVGPVSLRADYWSIDPDFRGLSNDKLDDKYTVPFSDVQRRGTTGFFVEGKASVAGFGVKAYFDNNALFTDSNVNLSQFGVSVDGKVSILSLGAYYDSLQGKNYVIDLDGNGPDKTDIDGDGNVTEIVETGMQDLAIGSASRLGVTAGVNLAGFDVKGYYQAVTVDGVTVAYLPKLSGNGTPFKAYGAFADEDQFSKYGVDVSGKLANINLTASWKQDSGTPALTFAVTPPAVSAPASWVAADFDRTTIILDASTSFSAGILTLSPEAHYGYVNDLDAGTDDTTTVKVGAKASTTTLDAYLRPSFNASVFYTQTNHTDVPAGSDYALGTAAGKINYGGGDFTSTELAYSIGVKSEAFLFDKSTFALTYAGWQGKNRRYVPFSGTTAGTFADNPMVGDISLTGIYGEWNYYDLNFAYGDFTLNQSGVVNNGQAFKISYKVKF